MTCDEPALCNAHTLLDMWSFDWLLTSSSTDDDLISCQMF